MSSASAEPPVFLIVAGPNGSGKSSAYQDADIEAFGRSVWIINPDLLAARTRDVEGLKLAAANLEAVRRIEAWLEASIQAHQTVGVETVLSTPKYRRLVQKARQLGFEVRLIYVLLDSPERNVERVRLRVKRAGMPFPSARFSNAMPDRSSSCPGSWSRPTQPGCTTTLARRLASSARSTPGSSRSTRTHCRRWSKPREGSNRPEVAGRGARGSCDCISRHAPIRQAFRGAAADPGRRRVGRCPPE